MTKTILLTGATDGIGFETAKRLAGAGHTLLIHGRSEGKLADVQKKLSGISGSGVIKAYRADLSKIPEVEAFASAIAEEHQTIDALINNAGVFNTPKPITGDGFDIRFMVNTIAPYLLTRSLLGQMSSSSRVVNLSSAAQAPVSLDALAGKRQLTDNQAYAQSKLAITMWSFHLANELGDEGPVIVAVNPASLLASKMVKDAYGVEGGDLGIGADILIRAALSDEFAKASGQYYDNDRKAFSAPHPDAMDGEKNKALVAAIDELLAGLVQQKH